MGLEGWLAKKGEKGPIKAWKRRFFRQIQDKLHYYRQDFDQDSLGFIPLDKVASVHPSLENKGFTFQINTADRVFYLQADNETNFNYWITGLVAFIKDTGTEKRLLMQQLESEEKNVQALPQKEPSRSFITRVRPQAKKSGTSTEVKRTINQEANSEDVTQTEEILSDIVIPTKALPRPPSGDSSVNNTISHHSVPSPTTPRSAESPTPSHKSAPVEGKKRTHKKRTPSQKDKDRNSNNNEAASNGSGNADGTTSNNTSEHKPRTRKSPQNQSQSKDGVSPRNITPRLLSPRHPSSGSSSSEPINITINSSNNEIGTGHTFVLSISPKTGKIGTDVLDVKPPGREPPLPPPDDVTDNITTERPVVSAKLNTSTNEQQTWAKRTAPSASPHGAVTRAPTMIFLQRDRSATTRKVNPGDSHRTKLVREVLSSEESYVGSLELLVHHYLIPIRKHPDKRASREVSVIFSNIEQILDLNRDLLVQIRERVANWSDTQLIGDIFIKVAPYLKLYSAYGTNYEVANNTYQRELKENPAFKEFVESKNLETGTATMLHHLLIMPIQRIPRYNLLLNDIIKNTEDTHQDYHNLIQALERTQGVAKHLNESVRASEMDRNIAELSERMEIGLLLAPHRRLIKEAAFKVIINKKEKRYVHHVLLFTDILVVISRSKIKKAIEFTHPANYWPLALVWVKNRVEQGGGGGHQAAQRMIEVVGPLHTVVLCCESEEDARSWSLTLSSTIREHLKSSGNNPIGTEPNAPLPEKRFGTYACPDGSEYCGSWLNGEKHGTGAFKFYHNYYEGEFEHNKMNGTGTMNYATGEVYTGSWANNLPNGIGAYGAPNGDTYDGSWLDGRKDGQGKFSFNNGDFYVGAWAQDVPHGKGKMRYATGKRYEGMWHRGLRQGSGTFDYGNGANYEGEWLLDKRHGHGTMVEKDGSYYEGDFANDMMEGSGVMVCNDGRKFSGKWKANKLNGQAVFTSAIGHVAKYEGEWLNGLFHGKGSLLFDNGDKYDGFFRDARFHGTGTLIHGVLTIDGKWNNGILEGKVSVKFENEPPTIGTAKENNTISFNETFCPPMILPTLSFYLQAEL